MHVSDGTYDKLCDKCRDIIFKDIIDRVILVSDSDAEKVEEQLKEIEKDVSDTVGQLES